MLLGLLRNEHASGPYNMTAPLPVTNREFTAILAKALHRPASFVMPAWLLKAAMGERACLLLEGQKVLPGKFTATGYRFVFANLPEALKDLLGK